MAFIHKERITQGEIALLNLKRRTPFLKRFGKDYKLEKKYLKGMIKICHNINKNVHKFTNEDFEKIYFLLKKLQEIR